MQSKGPDATPIRCFLFGFVFLRYFEFGNPWRLPSVCFALLCFALLCFALRCFDLLCFASLVFALQCFASLCIAWPWFKRCHVHWLLASLCFVMTLRCNTLILMLGYSKWFPNRVGMNLYGIRKYPGSSQKHSESARDRSEHIESVWSNFCDFALRTTLPMVVPSNQEITDLSTSNNSVVVIVWTSDRMKTSTAVPNLGAA